MKSARGSEYVCGACGETFISEWSDEEAVAEADATFTAAELEDAAVVCEDCWQAMRRQMPDFDSRYERG